MAAILVPIASQLSQPHGIYIPVEKVTVGCFPVKAFRLHGLFMHELHFVEFFFKYHWTLFTAKYKSHFPFSYVFPSLLNIICWWMGDILPVISVKDIPGNWTFLWWIIFIRVYLSYYQLIKNLISEIIIYTYIYLFPKCIKWLDNK